MPDHALLEANGEAPFPLGLMACSTAEHSRRTSSNGGTFPKGRRLSRILSTRRMSDSLFGRENSDAPEEKE